jgi:hypothetical protein
MSIAGIAFGVYLLVGMCLSIGALASRGKERRATAFDVTDGTAIGAGLLLLILLLWPVWALAEFLKSRRESTTEHNDSGRNQ